MQTKKRKREWTYLPGEVTSDLIYFPFNVRFDERRNRRDFCLEGFAWGPDLVLINNYD